MTPSNVTSLLHYVLHVSAITKEGHMIQIFARLPEAASHLAEASGQRRN